MQAIARTLMVLVLVAVLGAVLSMSEGIRTLFGGESVGQKLDKGIARTNGVIADAGERARDSAGSAVAKVEQSGEKISGAVSAKVGDTIDSGAARVNAATGAVTDRIEQTSTGVSDAAITASIKTDLLKDPYLSARRIDVSTVRGEVTLRGVATSDTSRQRATRMAGAVAGVSRVNNELTLTDAVAGK